MKTEHKDAENCDVTQLPDLEEAFRKEGVLSCLKCCQEVSKEQQQQCPWGSTARERSPTVKNSVFSLLSLPRLITQDHLHFVYQHAFTSGSYWV